MELHAGQVVPGDGGRERAAMIRPGGHIAGLADAKGEGMGEIHVRPGRQAGEQRRRRSKVEAVPAHVRHLAVRIDRFEANHISSDPIEAWRFSKFEAARGHQLHANADAQERRATHSDGGADRLDDTGSRRQGAPAGAEGADPRQDDCVGAGDDVRIIGCRDCG